MGRRTVEIEWTPTSEPLVWDIGQHEPGKGPVRAGLQQNPLGIELWLILEVGSTPILSLPEKTGPNGEPDRLPDETLRMREPVVILLAWQSR